MGFRLKRKNSNGEESKDKSKQAKQESNDDKEIASLIEDAKNKILQNQLSEALHDLGKVLVVRPNNIDALVQRGEIYRRQRKLEDALIDLNKALAISPDDYPALCARGDVYREQGKFEDALVDLNKVVTMAIAATKGHALLVRGELYQQ